MAIEEFLLFCFGDSYTILSILSNAHVLLSSVCFLYETKSLFESYSSKLYPAHTSVSVEESGVVWTFSFFRSDRPLFGYFNMAIENHL